MFGGSVLVRQGMPGPHQISAPLVERSTIEARGRVRVDGHHGFVDVTAGEQVRVDEDGSFERWDPMPGTWLLGVARPGTSGIVASQELACDGGVTGA